MLRLIFGPYPADSLKRCFFWGLILLSICAFGLFWFRPAPTSPARFITASRVRVLELPSGARVNSVAFSPDGKLVALAAPTGQVWDTERWVLRRNYQSQEYPRFGFDSTHFSPKGRLVSFGGEIFDLGKSQRMIPFRDGVANHVGLLFSPDGRTVAGASKNALAFWKIGQRHPEAIVGDAAALRDRKSDASRVPFISTAAFSSDGRYIVTGNTKGEVLLWSVGGKKLARILGPTRTLGARGAGVTRVAFSPDGTTVAATDAKTIILWDARSGKERIRWKGPPDVSMIGLAFSPNGKVLATGGPYFPTRPPVRRIPFLSPVRYFEKPLPTQGEIDLWEVPSGRLKTTMRDGKWIIHVAFSPNGKLIATSGDDHTAMFWDVPR